MTKRLLAAMIGGVTVVSLSFMWLTHQIDGSGRAQKSAGIPQEARSEGLPPSTSLMQHAGAAKAPPKATGHIDPQRTAYALALNPSTQTSIRNAGIDEALEAEGRHPERERVLRDQVLSALKDDPSGQQLQVTCGETICRLDIEKPGNEGLRWHEIDDAIHSVAKGGELIFNAEPVGERAVAAVYLAVADTTLPVDYEDPEEQD